MHKALHRGRALLHRRQVSRHRVRLRVVGGLGRMVGLVTVALLLNPSRILHAPLIKAPGFRGVPAVRLEARRRRWTSVPDVIHARPRLLSRGFLRVPFIFPLTHPLGAHRGRPRVVLTMECGVRGHSRLGLKRNNSSLNTVRAGCVRVGWIRRLVLRIGRLRRRHPIIMHGRPAIVPWAVCAVRHQRVRSTSTWTGGRGRLHHGSRRVVVRISNPGRWLGHLGRLLGLLRRRRRRRCRVVRGRWGRWAAPELFRHPVGFLIRPHLLFRLGTRLPLTGRSWATKGLPLCGIRVWRLWRRVDIRDPTCPRTRARAWSAAVEHRLRGLRGRCGPRASPLRAGRTNRTGSLVGLRVNVSWHRRLSWWGTIRLSISQQLQPSLDVRVRGVQLGGTLVRVQSIRDLVVAGLILRRVAVSDRSGRIRAELSVKDLPECRGRTKLPRCKG